MYPEAFHAGIMGGGGDIKGLISEWDSEKAPSGSNLVSGGPNFAFTNISDQSFFCNGSNDYITLSGVGNLLITGLTIIAVLRYEIYNDGTIIDIGTSSLGMRGLWVRGVNIQRFLVCSQDYRRNSYYNPENGRTEYNAGLNNYCITCDGSESEVNINNGLSTYSPAGTASLFNDRIRFANGIVYNTTCNTYIKRVLIFNRKLTRHEAAMIYNDNKSRFSIP